MVSRHRQAAGPEEDAELVDYGVIVARFPQVYQPEVLRRPLGDLARECETITRHLGSNERWHEEIKKVFGVPYQDGSGVGLDVLGVRAWYRTVLMNGDPRPLKKFATWDAEHDRLADSEITFTSTEAELDTSTARRNTPHGRDGACWEHGRPPPATGSRCAPGTGTASRSSALTSPGWRTRRTPRARSWGRRAPSAVI
ncbi:hypothetical protein [Streptomyces sp. KM273126]|uniref:hypothetical protein n=1 Tax=Streptomyces sp. KM273126 TaxID=2545247 RepID=UPI00215D7995|nr:hypothetical protein [Streptomyces sp. KM273126]